MISRGQRGLGCDRRDAREFDPERSQQLQKEILTLVLSTIGIAARYVRVVPERWIVKSTAGKISRKETRVRFLEERAELVRA